ncbi:uncharacterized protein TrAFT101_000911 [Trichoderma asperellum]|uniref:uncharacterized protein n=1 Tax=Trichoderma asperellum TaxID=101201 RepID=UPI00332F0464|nr:hypothetical protein TrAFT101_000911 [Trichoderma asperellum]
MTTAVKFADKIPSALLQYSPQEETIRVNIAIIASGGKDTCQAPENSSPRNSELRALPAFCAEPRPRPHRLRLVSHFRAAQGIFRSGDVHRRVTAGVRIAGS